MGGVQKVRRLTRLKHNICKSYFITFQHSFLQLKSTWSGVSPKLGFDCRTIAVLAVPAALSQPFAVQILSPTKLSLRMGGSGPPSNTWFLGPTRVFAGLKILTDQQTDHANPSATIGRIYIVRDVG